MSEPFRAKPVAAPFPVVLIVRDGWGRNPHPEYDAFNAVKLASTPCGDRLLREFPWTLIRTSGEDVGLPAGTMGNSEVGHQNLGAGRIVDQESVRITKSIRMGAFFENEGLCRAIERAKARGATVHLLGIASDAGVHGLIAHLEGCLELCRRLGAQRVAVHCFTDGRDTGPYTGAGYVARIAERCREIGVGAVASVIGRYWAMDRDNRWERVAEAYRCLTDGSACPNFASGALAVESYYAKPVEGLAGDEFVAPSTVGTGWRESRVRGGDTVIFWNYRGDRPRELTRAFVMEEFEGHVKPSPDTGTRGFDRGKRLDLAFVTMTAYEEALSGLVEVAFPKPPRMKENSGEYLAANALAQFRCAETEKFPHVTFFYNDYRDEPFAGEHRRLAQSPKVATYDLAPEMSAFEVRDAVLERIAARDCEAYILVNFANADMVGHTGVLDAAVRAVETVDACVGAIVDAALARGGTLIVTADHGNAEQMWDPESNAPHTAHTTYDVECIVVDVRYRGIASGSADVPSRGLRADGRLADVFPTILTMMGLDQPAAMTGRSLILESRK